jgi:very-short-patch-repair endonuclease
MNNSSDRYRPIREQPSCEKAACAEVLKQTQTSAERILWSRLRASRLGGFHFRRQCVIRGFIADFYCHEARLVVELDGPIHDNQITYDADRDRLMTALGLYVLRYKNAEVENALESVTKSIYNKALERR